tara:strand:+ start:36 stop:491 length:456 start_codon:yes stop_codon:yes gene_type:complete
MEENICSICYEEINTEDNNTYTLECNHCYHAACIIKWFRNNHNNCPLCNDATIDTNLCYYQKLETIEEIKKLGRKKNCPSNIKKILEKIKKCKVDAKNAATTYTEFRKSNKTLLNLEQKLRTNKYRKKRQIRLLEYQLLAQITINPIYIKK